MNQQRSLSWLRTTLACLATALAAASSIDAAVRPNVLFIAVDDLRAEIGCYGAAHVKTPHIDRLAGRGMRFDRAYVQAAFCNPSRVSFLTGLRPDRTRVLDNRTWFRRNLPEVVTLPQLFKQNGYHTLRLGKIYHGDKSMDDPRAWHEAVYPKITERGRRGEGRNLTGGEVNWCHWKAAEGTDLDQPDGQIAQLAVDFLKRKHEQPFLLAVGFHKPHDPFIAPAKYFEHYPLDAIELHGDPSDRKPDVKLAIPPGGWKQSFDRFSDTERREFLRAYYACTTFVDAQIGKVLDALAQSDARDNTVVILISDHGYHLGERGWWNKNTLFELTARTPMIVYAPGMKAAGRSCRRLVEFVDIYPTLAELCGLPAPDGLTGRSMAPLLDDPEQPWKEAAFTQLVRGPAEGRTVRTERWRYTEWDQGRAGVELYDHQSDPGEYRNLVDDPRFADVRASLRQRLRQGTQATTADGPPRTERVDVPTGEQFQADGWITLFDGTNLDRWTMGPDRSWVVQDGLIALRREFDGKEHNRDYLWTKEQFGDFILELQFKVPQRANSGVFLRTSDREDPVFTGLELQVANSFGRAELSRGGTLGALYDLQAPSVDAAKPAGEWNTYRVTCRGPLVRVEVNSKLVNEANLDRWTEPRQNPDGSPNKFPRAIKQFARRGYLGLQDHGRPVWYRNIRVKRLGD